MTDFRARIDRFLAEYLERNPTAATAIGEHRYDDRWPDLAPAAREDRLAFIDRWHAELSALDGLSAEDAIDRDLLVLELEADRFGETDLREEAWNPLEWVYLLGGGLFPLIAREFAPLAARLASVAGRLESTGAVVAAALEELGSVPGRPVGRFQTEKALEQLPGVIELAEEALELGEGSGEADVAAVMPRLRSAAASAKAALDRFERHLRDVVLPASRVRPGWARTCSPGRCATRCGPRTLTPERILAQADREFAAVRAEMVRIAGDIWARGDRACRDRPTTRPSSGACWTRSPPITRTGRSSCSSVGTS